MGDRNNPIKFGPEWLRNLSRERSARSNNNHNVNPSSGTSSMAGSSGGPVGATSSSAASSSTNSTTSPKVLLAKLRYGREEMLALYDRNAEAPPELKGIETLYQPRGKQPAALNNTFEDDVRDNMRSAPPIGHPPPSGDRFLIGRGRGLMSDGRGRPRGSYIRHPSLGRGGGMWHVNPRMPLFNVGADEDGGPNPPRPWVNNSLNVSNRNSGDLNLDWSPKNMFRSKRPGNNTNWRQTQSTSRDDGEEWRSPEPGRSRQLEKWDRDWGDRPSNDNKPQPWVNRRTWVAGDSQNNEENLPEWAVESAECGGTFDASGAFHGYSNDDSNLPKHQDSPYPLTRSHTHGGVTRSKILEGSEEWWASEKAKKLSPKRFDASDLKFNKKQAGTGTTEGSNASGNNKSDANDDFQEIPEKLEVEPDEEEEEAETSNASQGENQYAEDSAFSSDKFTESKTFDALMRSDIDLEEASDERGNFQSVLINANNSLRQKHQHLVPSMKEGPGTTHNMKGPMKSNQDMDLNSLKSAEEMLVDNIFGMTLDDKEMHSTQSSNSFSNSGMSSSIPQNQNMPMGMSNSAMPNHGMGMDMHLNSQNLQSPPVHHAAGMPPVVMNASGMQPGMPSGMQGGLHMGGMPVAMQNAGYPAPLQNMPGMPSASMQNLAGMSSGGMQNMPGIQAPRVQTPGMQPVMQNVGITNSALNASLGLPINPNIGQPYQGMPQQVIQNNSTLGSPGIGVLGSSSMQSGGNMPGFPSGGGMGSISNNGNSSLFLSQNSNNTSMSAASDMPMSNHSGQNSMMMNLGMQGSQNPFGNSIYGNNPMPGTSLMDQWYYEDPERNIQGPFSSKDMYSWYKAGFFSPSLMVRRACETMMRPLGTYGPVVPFAKMDVMSQFPMSSGFDRPQGPHDNLLNSQSLGLDVMNMGPMNLPDSAPMDLQFGSVGLLASQNYAQPQMVDSLWSQGPTSSGDMMWMQQPRNRSEARVNNLPIYFWQPSAINSNSLLPEEIAKEMKTEDQILAQLRATQNMGPPPSQPFMNELQGSAPPTASADDCFAPNVSATPNLEELHKLIQKETLAGQAPANSVPEPEISEPQPPVAKPVKLEHSVSESSVIIVKPLSNKNGAELKQQKQAKETDKTTKNKENNNTKNKNKKSKEEKRDEVDNKVKEEEVAKVEKRSQEPSPSKSKKEEKTKKDIEKEKKEWIKEGFTIVKGAEKSSNKDNKKKAEEARAAEEAERKRKEEEKLASEEEKKKKQLETAKKQQEQQAQQQQRQASESVIKKAPWSSVTSQTMQATNKDGLTLAEIQRLEREKKLEQMKEQQQMMQIIAQQQAAALAREQEMQAGLGWAKKKGNNHTQGPSLTEIQAETRKQAMAAAVAAAAAAKVVEEAEAAVAPPQTNHAPWANTHNGVGGFWDTQPNSGKDKGNDAPKPSESTGARAKKKQTLTMPLKKDLAPAIEFEAWCTNVLASWSSKIDVPTFVGFLKDIESPYEVKDYVKCYLGESKESNDFARQFLERRSKLLRVGMVTPSDDLCSPAIAVNPRTTSGSDYQEVKGKGKKSKKNKMLKVDVRILGFSVTAAEDRINVGDIDTV